MRTHVGQDDRAGLVDQQAEDPAPSRGVPDFRMRCLVDSAGQETLEPAALGIKHTDRRVARARQIARGLQQPLEHHLEVEFHDEGSPGLE